MPSLAKCLCRCAAARRGRHTARRIIIIKNRKQFDLALSELLRRGIQPIKAVRGCRMLCLHLHKGSHRLLVRHPQVLSCEKDIWMAALGHPSAPLTVHPGLLTAKRTCRTAFSRIPWNIRQVGAPSAWLTTLGGGIRLAIIDTGVGPHSDLSLCGGVNVIGGKSYRDDNGHGTHVAGIAAAKGRTGAPAGVAPAASLYAVKALDADGNGNLSDIIEALDWCIAKEMQVVNMSLGMPPGNRSKALHSAIRRAHRSGIVLVAAAGNLGKKSGGIDLPAAYPETIAVAASIRRGGMASFSSRGKGIDLTAPGERISSTWLKGRYAVESGTSMSTPHVAGGAALLLAVRPDLQAGGVVSALKLWARRLPGYGVRTQGAGLLQLKKIASLRPPAAGKSKR